MPDYDKLLSLYSPHDLFYFFECGIYLSHLLIILVFIYLCRSKFLNRVLHELESLSGSRFILFKFFLCDCIA